MVVQHNMQALNANRMLGVTTGQQSKATEKLSSGYRINRAADDAAGLSISEKMRKQIRGLDQASTNAQDGVSCVQTAEGALTEVHAMLQRMNELAVQSANGTNSESDRQAIQDEIDQLVTEIDRVAETTKFNETYLLKGDKTGISTEYSYSSDKAAITDMDGNEVTLLDKCGTKLSVAQTKEAIEKGEQLYKTVPTGFTETDGSEVEDDGGTFIKLNKDLYDKNGHKALSAGEVIKVADFTAGDYYEDDKAATVVADWTDQMEADVKFVTKDIYSADGSLKFKEGTEITDDDETALTNGAYSTTEVTLGEKAVEGTDYKITEPQLFDKDGNKIAANGIQSYFKENDEGIVVYQGGMYDSNGNAIGTKGNTLEEDEDLKDFISASNTGKGSLNLSLHVGADATKNNQIELKIDAMDATTLGIKGIKVDGATDDNSLDAIDTIKAAIQRVSSQRSALGAVQNRLEHTIANLDNVVENTTAAESRIRDTDMAEMMVEYSKNNILAQAGQSMLAQANQSTQGVLSLLQ